MLEKRFKVWPVKTKQSASTWRTSVNSRVLMSLGGCRWWWGMKRWRMMERWSGCQGDSRCRMLHADNVKKSRLEYCKSHMQHHSTFEKENKQCINRFPTKLVSSTQWREPVLGEEVGNKKNVDISLFYNRRILPQVWTLHDKDNGEEAPVCQIPWIHCPSTAPGLHKSGCQQRIVSLS